MTRYAPRTPFKFSIHLPDHVADTVHLSAEEHGCYMRLLFSYWRSGPPKDDDRVLARIAGLSVEEWADGGAVFRGLAWAVAALADRRRIACRL